MNKVLFLWIVRTLTREQNDSRFLKMQIRLSSFMIFCNKSKNVGGYSKAIEWMLDEGLVIDITSEFITLHFIRLKNMCKEYGVCFKDINKKLKDINKELKELQIMYDGPKKKDIKASIDNILKNMKIKDDRVRLEKLEREQQIIIDNRKPVKMPKIKLTPTGKLPQIRRR